MIKPGNSRNGRASFKLKTLAEANGIATPSSHDALTDVLATLALCKIISHRAPEIWSQFLRFSRRASVDSFIDSEDAFLISETFGNDHRPRIVTPIGTHSELAIRHYCLDVGAEFDALREMSDEELISLCKGARRPIVTVRTNAAPTLWALYEVDQSHLAPFEDEAEILERITHLRQDKPFVERLRRSAQAAEPVYSPSDHIEEQLYEFGFPPPQDKVLMQRFHAASWEARLYLARQLIDTRYRRLALRLIYLERPDLLSTEHRNAADEKIRKRLAASPDANVPWRSISTAEREVKNLLAEDLDGDELSSQLQYMDYLKQRAEVLALPMSNVN